MRIVSWIDGSARYGALEGETVKVLGGQWGSFAPTGAEFPVASLSLVSPVHPRSIVCVGLNYRLHAEESGLDLPERPALFTKLTSSVVASGDLIVRPRSTEKLDYEAELGVVIGAVTRDVAVEDALSHVAGYVCVNDVSARDLQRGDGYGWVRGKSADTFCPIGPFVVTADEIADPQALGMRTWVNGDLRQSSSTADMIFSVATVISFISREITLLPGDLICTGTPSGVGDGMRPQSYLQPGDVVTIEIDGLGRLENTVAGGNDEP